MRTADVAVVGGGVIGCLTAREVAARAPDASVVLLDRDGVGSGASRRSAGLHFPRGATERVRRMTAYSQDYYLRLKRARPELPIHALGMVVVATTSTVHDSYLPSARLAPTEAVPGIALPSGARAWRVEGGQYADVYALTQVIAHELRQRVSVREGVRVVAVEASAGGVLVRLGTGDELAVGRVVLAVGPWLAAPAWADLVRPLGARVKRVVALHLECEASEHDPAIVFQDEDAFLLPLPRRGHWLFSYTCTEWDVDPDAAADGLSAGHLDQARELLRRYAPGLAERIAAGRVFCDAYSSNREPQVRALDDHGHVVFAGAANGSGYRLAPAIAAEAADLVVRSSR